MLYETDAKLSPDLQKWGCAVEALAHYNPDITDEELNAIVVIAKSRGVLDAQDTVLDWQKLVDLFGYKLHYRAWHFLDPKDDPNKVYLVAEWHNSNNGFTHFVVMDGKGIGKANVIYDPIEGGSKTVRDGHFVSYRIFDKEVS
jgi:hypothetical protein